MHVYAAILVLVLNGIEGYEEAEDSLILIHAVVRHGSRTPDPIAAFPNDLYRNYSYYPYGEGELNKEGRIRSYQLGKKLRKRYNKFLGSTYYPSMVSAISSGSSRCRMTMQLVLASMFPPNSSEAFEKNLAWQPIPINYTDCKTDAMLCFHRCLPLLLSIQFNEKASSCKNRDFMNAYLTENSGMKVESVLSMMFVQDTLKSEVENNLPLAKWADPIWPEPLGTCTNDFWISFMSNETNVAITGGPLIRKILTDTKDKIDEKPSSSLPSRKLFIYAAHDYNINLLLTMLKYYNSNFSNYLDSILLEVHKINDIYGFKIFFDHQDGNGLLQLELPLCGLFCPVDDFYKMMLVYLNSKPCPL